METFLPSIEKPKSPVTRLAYAMARKQFGKVLTPLKVMYARLPNAFGVFVAKIAKLDKKLQLSPELAMLIRARVAQLNVCAFCIDIGQAHALKAAMSQARFDALSEYAASPLFNDAERAALDYVTELTRDRKVNPMTFARMAGHYSERAVCEVVWLVASEHFYNMTALGLNIPSDGLCEMGRKNRVETAIT